MEFILSTDRDSSTALTLIPCLVVANRSEEFRITVLEFHNMQRVKFSALIYHISSATILELEKLIFGAHFPHS